MKFASDGKCIQIPGQDNIPPKLGVRSYPVVERYNLVFIWTGDPEKADPKLILDYPPLADPKWRGLPGYMIFLRGRELQALYRPCYLDAQASTTRVPLDAQAAAIRTPARAQIRR